MLRLIIGAAIILGLVMLGIEAYAPTRRVEEIKAKGTEIEAEIFGGRYYQDAKRNCEPGTRNCTGSFTLFLRWKHPDGDLYARVSVSNETALRITKEATRTGLEANTSGLTLKDSLVLTKNSIRVRYSPAPASAGNEQRYMAMVADDAKSFGYACHSAMKCGPE